ncbi:MAG TPA: V-type ATPase subunit [Gemmatimonadaceae bacterium]|nr:V-type ATPase subunit [Gemmatimonadaceae bacterium]
MSVWVDVVARARGLSSGILSDRQLSEIARSRDVAELLDRLTSLDIIPGGASAEPRTLELVVQRRAGARLRLVSRWSGARHPLLAPLFEDEDRRSIRAMLRGAAAHAPSDQRLAGLVPTPALPARALSELARQGDAAAVAALLVTWRNPYGSAILEETRLQQPDLFRLETILTRTWAERARRVAPRCGRAMRVFVARVVDVENAWTALLLAGHEGAASPATLWVEGGTLLPRDAFVLATGSRSRREAATILTGLLGRSPLAPAITPEPGAEGRALRAWTREQRDIARLDPLGPAPIIALLLRSRGELLTLRRIIWGIALGAPAGRRGAEGALVT